jgi:ribosomal protein S1
MNRPAIRKSTAPQLESLLASYKVKLETTENPMLPPAIDWDALSAQSGKRLANNVRVKRHRGDEKTQIFCHEPYAQELYEAYFGELVGLVEPKVNAVVKGKVISCNAKTASIDIGWREEAMIDLGREDKSYLPYIETGNEFEVIVEKVDPNGKKPVIVSLTKMVKRRNEEELMNSIGSRVAFPGKVESMIQNAGYYVDISGIRCFMPGSLGGMNKIVNFESLVGKELYVVPIVYSKEKECIVVSHRKYLESLIPGEVEKLIVGQRYDGFVTGTSVHGIFVEFNGCLTGLISKSDMSEEVTELFSNGRIKPGDTINFFLKEILEDNRLVLSINPVEPSPWETIEDRLKLNTKVSGKVKKITKFGVFIELEPKIVGLLHRSYLDEADVFEVGQTADAVVVKIDVPGKKVYLAS